MRGLTLSGLVLVGRFAGIDEGAFPRLLVEVVYADGQLFTYRLEYAAFDPRSGEPTPFGKDLMNAQPGQQVAVGVSANAHAAGRKRDGSPYAPFVVFKAVRIEVLQAESADGVA